MAKKMYLILDDCDGIETWYDEKGLFELGESVRMIAEDKFKFKDVNHVINYISDFNYILEEIK